MKKPRVSLLVILTAMFASFILGFLLGRNQNQGAIIVNVPQKMLIEPTQEPEPEPETTEKVKNTVFPININRCGIDELMKLPGVGEVLANRILDYREENGIFYHEEELLNVEGIGKKKLEEIIDLVTVGGLR